jgi:hypothetical protein
VVDLTEEHKNASDSMCVSLESVSNERDEIYLQDERHGEERN